MEIAKFQHACFTVKTGSSTLVVDPGEYTKDLIIPRDVAAVIITHEHADHCSYELTKRILKKSPKATIIGHPQTIAQFSNFQTTPVQPGDQLEIAGVSLRFFGGNHAPITSTVQTPPNIGVLINNSLYYAGDSFTNPGVPVDVLALPVSAPWLRIDESIRFLNEINPTYRAELSATTRHMTEFLHIDAEMGFVTFDELLDVAGGLLKSVTEGIWKTNEAELKQWNAQPVKLGEKIPRIGLEEVHELYTKATGEDTRGEKDLRPDEERFITEYTKKNMGSEAVFITEWPASEMKFYHKISEENPDLAERADLIFRGVEIATVSMRENRYDVLLDQLLTLAGGDPEADGFKYYLQAFKYGLPAHGGFGMGLERLTQKIIGLSNVKEASLFPRDINRLGP